MRNAKTGFDELNGHASPVHYSNGVFRDDNHGRDNVLK